MDHCDTGDGAISRAFAAHSGRVNFMRNVSHVLALIRSDRWASFARRGITMRSLKLAPPHSVILVMDPSARDLPKSMNGSLVSATPSAISIGTLAEVDGETEIRLGSDEEVDPMTAPFFVGELNTPTGVVSIRTVLDRELLSLDVGRERVTLRVWVNDSTEPTVVCIGVS